MSSWPGGCRSCTTKSLAPLQQQQHPEAACTPTQSTFLPLPHQRLRYAHTCPDKKKQHKLIGSVYHHVCARCTWYRSCAHPRTAAVTLQCCHRFYTRIGYGSSWSKFFWRDDLQMGPGPLQSSAAVQYPAIAGGVGAGVTSHTASSSTGTPSQPSKTSTTSPG